MLLHTPKGKDVTIDFQFAAPYSASKDMFGIDKSKAEKVVVYILPYAHPHSTHKSIALS